ncbi:MAG TPA: hypothetical protein GXZ66_09700 [Clostridiaceae bacterium]|jgi:hypothetical protein|nr:hypothetical protein [Clostridiaceae bacterium]HOA31940.1 GyrI-like domain-containing protein [Clostridia bacterium]
MKHEWRKHEKELYIPKEKPELVDVPPMNFITISGKGDPNQQDFADRIGALYPIAYAIRMMPRNGFTPEGYFEYTVYPLEGVWDLTEEGRKKETLVKDDLVYTIMIRQPDFVTREVFERAVEIAKKKKNNPLFDEVRFETIKDGLSVQMMHVGPFDEEHRTFEKMKEYISENNLKLKTLVHREIYISDIRKTEQEKLKTVLRYLVENR